jgi:hypothetical protein
MVAAVVALVDKQVQAVNFMQDRAAALANQLYKVD